MVNAHQMLCTKPCGSHRKSEILPGNTFNSLSNWSLCSPWGNQGKTELLLLPSAFPGLCRRWKYATPNTPVEHNNYFELKATEKKQTQENLSGLPLSTRKARVTLNHRRHPWANKRWHQRNLYNKLYWKNPYLLLASPTHLLSHSLPPLKA